MPRQLLLDEGGRGPLALRLEALEDVVLQAVLVRREAREVGVVAVGLGEEVEEVEGAAGGGGEVGGDGRDDAPGGAGDDEDAVLAERHPGRPVLDRQLAHPDRGAEAVRRSRPRRSPGREAPPR